MKESAVKDGRGESILSSFWHDHNSRILFWDHGGLPLPLMAATPWSTMVDRTIKSMLGMERLMPVMKEGKPIDMSVTLLQGESADFTATIVVQSNGIVINMAKKEQEQSAYIFIKGNDDWPAAIQDLAFMIREWFAVPDFSSIRVEMDYPTLFGEMEKADCKLKAYDDGFTKAYHKYNDTSDHFPLCIVAKTLKKHRGVKPIIKDIDKLFPIHLGTKRVVGESGGGYTRVHCPGSQPDEHGLACILDAMWNRAQAIQLMGRRIHVKADKADIGGNGGKAGDKGDNDGEGKARD